VGLKIIGDCPVRPDGEVTVMCILMVICMNHIMDILPKFREIIDNLENIKQVVVNQSEFDYTSQDARMVALDSLQISIFAVGM
jgi:hypothetical protein